MNAGVAAAPALSAADVSVRLTGALIVDRATLELKSGELTALIGPNGAGKTTLMRALAGLLPAEGRIALNGRALAALSAGERTQHRLPAAGRLPLADERRRRGGAGTPSPC